VPAYFNGGTVPWVKTQELTDCILTETDEHISEDAVRSSSAKLLPADTVLMAMYGATVGQLGVLARPMTCNQACAAMVVDSSKHDFRFLYYQLLAARNQIRSLAVGAAQQNLSGAQIKQFILPFPPFAEQRQIADLLWLLDRRIDLLRQTNATLESIAQALFKSWFVDFDPVRAKAEGHEPDGMNAETATLFPSTFEGTELGKVPVGWKPRPIEELAEKVGMGPFGSNIKVSTFVESGIPVLNGSCLKGMLLDEVNCNFITEQHAERLAGSLVRVGDIVITHRGTLGQVSLIASDSEYPTYMLSQSQFYLRTNREETTPEFMSYFLTSATGQHLLLANAAQVGVPSISRPVTYLKSIRLVVPSIQVASAFSDLVAPLHRRIILGRRQISVLGRLRDNLLPRLISGKLLLPEAEAQLDEVAA
jgi:type I restriction enzyme, S subunit